MIGKETTLRNVFSTNRAEEMALDVWDDFVVPLFFDKLDVQQARKARRIVGGRGCGKTMLLRYLSYHTQFSKGREKFDQEDLAFVGLYWRADTNFLPMLSKQGIQEEEWVLVFKHYLTLITAIEILKALSAIAQSKHNALTLEHLKQLNFDNLQDYDASFGGTIEEMLEILVRNLRQCETAIHNPNSLKELWKLPDSFIEHGLIPSVTSTLVSLKDTTFMIYVDEYENLLAYQQRTINTRIKHCQSPLIYHIAMKRNGMDCADTLGEEKIQDIADYRTIDLDAHLSEGSDFELFCAEILLLRLKKVDAKDNTLNAEDITSSDHVADRQSIDYRKKVISKAKLILPSLSHSELAAQALETPNIKNKIIKELKTILADRDADKNITVDNFMVSGFESATIIMPALLSREGNDLEGVLREFRTYIVGDPESRFTKSGWITNNFIGCYLRYSRPYDNPCSFYSGFQTFVKLSKGNVRHFLELCNEVVLRNPKKFTGSFDIESQAIATRMASEEILNETVSYGRKGELLRKFTYNLGNVFEYAQQRITQSEPELNHFSIKGGFSGLSNEDLQFIREAEKWGVLYLEKSTKEKDRSSPDQVEWILNPIYAPFFFLSYRKKRKIELTPEQFSTLYSGSENSLTILLNSFQEKWNVSKVDKPFNQKLF